MVGGPIKYLFLSTFRVKNVHVEVGGGRKKGKTVSTYRKVASSRLSQLVACFYIFRLFMKGNSDAYVL